MPKLKTHKGARRRLQVTGSGKIMRSKIGKSHFRRRKPGRVKRQYSGKLEVSHSSMTQVKHLLPYG